MTDYEKLKKTFAEIGVKFKEDKYDKTEVTINYGEEVKYNNVIKLNEGVGYYDFYCEFYFFDGKLQNHGVWE